MQDQVQPAPSIPTRYLSYEPPVWARNATLNTILSNNGPRKRRILRQAAGMNMASKDVILDCGKGVYLHGLYTEGANPDLGLVIFIHGWEGCADSIYLLSAANRLYQQGYSIFRLHMRDHGPSHHLNEGPFLAVRLDEILGGLEEIEARLPHDHKVLVGFSLGGNLTVRVAANLAGRAVRLNKALAICPAIDPKIVGRTINDSPIYNRYFLRKWRKSFTKKMQHFEQYGQMNHMLAHRSILSMHEEFIPLYSDYKTADDYFDAYALTGKNLKRLDIDCRILMAADDPVIPIATADRLPSFKGLSLDITSHGGHCGFVKNNKLEAWSDDYIADYVTASL